jgi:sec-independent protein translocase protein TatA
MFSNLKGWEWLIIVALILLLFGAKRLPDAARGLGRSLRIFKAETKGLAGSGEAETVVAVEDIKSVTDGEIASSGADSTAPEAKER